MRKVSNLCLAFLIAFTFYSNTAKAQFVYIITTGSDFCTWQNINYAVGNYDPAFTYNWYIEDYSNFDLTGQSVSYLFSSGPSLQMSNFSYGIDIRVEMVDNLGNVVAMSSVSQTNNINPYTIPVYFNNGGCGFLEVAHPYSMTSSYNNNRWAMWYKDGVPTGWQYPHLDGPFPNGGIYTYKLLLNCGDTLESLPIQTYGTAVPVVTASGPTTFCNGDSVTLTLQTPGYSIWNWSKNGNNIGGANTTSIKVFDSGSYTAQVYNGAGGGGNCFQTTAPIVVTENSGALITANSTGCTGDSILLQCNAATTYQWKRNGVVINGATTQNIWVKTGGQYQVVTTGLTCNTSTPKTITFYPKATLSVSPTGPVSLCTNTATTLVASGTNIFKYEWYRNNLALIGSNTAALTVTKGGTYKCVVTNQVGCTKSSSAATVSFPASSALPVNTLTIQPDTSGIDSWVTCAFGNFNSNYANTPLMEISNWFKYFRTAERAVLKFDLSKLPVNAPIVSSNLKLWIDTIATKNNTAQNLNFKRFTQNWNENSINWNNEPDSTTFQSVMVPLQSLISKSYLNVNIIDFIKHWSFVPAENYGMLVQMDELTDYGWWMEIASGDNTTATHRPKLTIQYSYAKIDTSGPLNLCTGGSVTFTTNPGYSYQWYKNGIAIAGATSNAYTANSAGNYYVTLSNNSGCSVNSETRTVSINATPVVHITPAGPITICLANSLVLTADSLWGYTFQWKRNGTIIAGATQRKYTATQGGTYSVTITSNCGLSGTGSVQCTQISNPLPTITAGGPTTFCAGQSVLFTANSFAGVSYQWKKNGADLGGQTNATYTANTAGSYAVKETANGCSRTSTSTVVTINCRNGNYEEDDFSILVSPDPFTHSAELILPEDVKTEQVKFMLFDLNGKLIQTIPCTGKSTTLNRNYLQAGMYLLKTFSEDRQIGINKILIRD